LIEQVGYNHQVTARAKTLYTLLRVLDLALNFL